MDINLAVTNMLARLLPRCGEFPILQSACYKVYQGIAEVEAMRNKLPDEEYGMDTYPRLYKRGKIAMMGARTGGTLTDSTGYVIGTSMSYVMWKWREATGGRKMIPQSGCDDVRLWPDILAKMGFRNTMDTTELIRFLSSPRQELYYCLSRRRYFIGVRLDEECQLYWFEELTNLSKKYDEHDEDDHCDYDVMASTYEESYYRNVYVNPKWPMMWIEVTANQR